MHHVSKTSRELADPDPGRQKESSKARYLACTSEATDRTQCLRYSLAAFSGHQHKNEICSIDDDAVLAPSGTCI